MKKLILFFAIVCLLSASVFSQTEPIKLHGETQGSFFNITYFDKENRNFNDDVVKILKSFDNSVSTYSKYSIITMVNNNVKDVVIDEYFKACFLKSQEVSRNTDGAFDATVAPLVNAWGFGPERKLKMDQSKIDSILKFVGYKLVELKDNKIIKKDPRVCFDFNAFAPGYSVDIVSKFLESKGITSYLVEIGGEVFGKGKKPNGDNWKVGIEKPIENKESENPLKAIIKIDNIAIATSGNYRKFIQEDGQKYAHHIDPRTGYPTKNNLLSVSCIAKDCMSADANATGMLVMGLEKTIKFLETHSELKAYLIYSDDKGNYKIFESPGLKGLISEVE